MMSVQNNMSALNANMQSKMNNLKLQTSLQKLASGYRINKAADDAAGLAISEKMRAQITGLERSMMNAWDGVSLVQTAEGSLDQVHSMLNRLTDLSMQASNGILNADQRQSIQSEANSILSEIDRISQSSNFNGKQLLDGNFSEDFAIGEGGETKNVAIDDMSVSGLGLSGLDLTTASGASSAISTIRNAIDTVSSTRGDLGAAQNGLEHTINNLAVTNENMIAAESRIRDADMAKQFMDYTKNNILGQVSMSMQSHSSMQAQQVLQLLR